MSDYTMTNEKVWSWLISRYPQFQDLALEDGILKYNGATLDTKNYDLRELFIGSNALLHDMDDLSSSDLFRIIGIHTEEETILKVEPEFYKIVNEGKEQKEKVINVFHKFIAEATKYREYLTQGVSGVLSRYESYIISLEMQGENLTPAQLNEIEYYNQMYEMIISNTNKKEKQKTLQRQMLSVAGYVNIFLLLLLTILSGITIGFLIIIFFGI